MKLLFNPASPFSRKVRIALLEKDLIGGIEMELVQPWPEPTAITPFNPLGKIPVLILDGGAPLYDSPVICEYVDSLAVAPSLLPPSGPLRWRILRQQALADGCLDAAVNIVYERRRPEAERSVMMTERFTSAIRRSLEHLAGDLSNTAGLFDLGQISLACAIGYLNFRLPDLDFVTDTRLQAWWDVARHRDSVKFTDPTLT
jgi:glutathione S-transferase